MTVCMKSIGKVIVLALAGMALLGCQSLNPPRRSRSTSTDSPEAGGAGAKQSWDDLAPEPIEEFPEVPIPSRFTLVPKESFTATSDLYRVAHLKYIGSYSVQEVLKFYRDQMPASGWKLEYVMGLDVKVMDFAKEGDKSHCRITIGPSTIRKTQIMIDIR